MQQITDENFTIVDGKSYTIIWNGIIYQCVATIFEGVHVLGNLHIAISVAPDTGEPFLFAINPKGEKVVYANDTAATHTITVRWEIVYPIASEFLPGEYALADHTHDEYITETELASKGYLTSETDPTVPAWAKAETKPSYDFSELTVNDPEAAKTALAIENGMILKDLQAAMPSYAWWNSITYGNGKFVAVVYESNKAAYSNDGITWTATTLPSNEMWNSVTYGNGKFVAIADDSVTAAYSEDGITWTATTMTNSERWSSVAYGNGKFVTVAGNSNKAAYSEDGITWTATTMPSSKAWTSITYGNGKFVAVVANSTKVAYSEDGITWKNSIECLSQNNSNITEDVRSIIGIPSYSTANNGQFLRVIDGIPTWTEFLPTLTSPNGTKYQLTVSDDGTLSAVVVS